MGQDGAFDGPTNNNQLGKESPPVEISGGYQSGGGYYGKPAGDIPPPTPVAVGQNLPAGQEDLPVTECPVGWKCVAEFFCDVTATMVPQRVSLNKAQLAIRGDLIVSILIKTDLSINLYCQQCMNQATGQFNVCCRAPRPSPQLSPQLRPEASSEVRPEASPEVPSSSSLDPTRIQFEKEESLTSCPVVRVLPPIELCANRKSTCWSAGLPDTDCIDNALCCFDGCANVCLGRGEWKSFCQIKELRTIEVLSLVIPDRRPIPDRPQLQHQSSLLNKTYKKTSLKDFQPIWPQAQPSVLRSPVPQQWSYNKLSQTPTASPPPSPSSPVPAP